MKKREFWRLCLALAAVFLLSGSVCAECEHSYQWEEVSPTCEEAGYRGEVCVFCGETRVVESVDKLGHDWSEWTTVVEATCAQKGLEESTCARCGKTQSREVEKLEHSYSVWVQAPTCSRNGYTLYTCTVCGHEEQTDRVEKTGHSYLVIVVAPTCTADGYTKYQCVNCTQSYKTDLVEKTGHCYDSGVVTKQVSLTSAGKIRYTCVNCGEAYTVTVPKWTNPFVDLEKDQYYFDSVLWAYNQGVTTGTDRTHFSPDQVCTRAQVVTFLWRQAGEPEPENTVSVFEDVVPGTYYYDAVLWAIGQGITNGTDSTHFSPDLVCTRCQVVTFLYRAKGETGAGYRENFTDVNPGDYFYEAVCWAYGSGITVGTSETAFSPHLDCTRGQIVTFLCRAKE